MNSASLDFMFTIPIAAGSIRMKILGITCTEPYLADTSDYMNIVIRFDDIPNKAHVILGLGSTPELIDEQYFPIGNCDPREFRVCLFNTLLVIYQNDQPIFTYTFRSISRTSDVDVSIIFTSENTSTLSDVTVVELSEGREAVFADYESTTESALQSIIQQRPVIILPRGQSNIISFTYQAVGNDVATLFPKRITFKHSDNQELSSDGIVYFSDVKGINDLEVARRFGFITRLYRFPDLDDITHPVRAMQERALEQTNTVEITQRLDPRIEALDVIVFDKYISATNRHIVARAIAENISFEIRDGLYSMTISGRSDSEQSFRINNVAQNQSVGNVIIEILGLTLTNAAQPQSIENVTLT